MEDGIDSQTAEKDKWHDPNKLTFEYQVINLYSEVLARPGLPDDAGTSITKALEVLLNQKGCEGWELAGINQELYILKRPRTILYL